MAYSDPNYRFLMGGSTIVVGAASHGLFSGTSYGGLSDLSATDVVKITMSASTGFAAVGPCGTPRQLAGIFLAPSAMITTLPMTRIDASQMVIQGIGTNFPVVYWSVWSKRPL